MDAQVDIGVDGPGRRGRDLARQGVGLANVIAGARAGFEYTAALQLATDLNRRRQADGVFLHHQPDRGETFTGFQGAAADRVEVVVGQLTVQGRGVHDDLSNRTTEVLGWKESRCSPQADPWCSRVKGSV
ncbi:hypothetical protein D3C73_888250 [compost metagenome]